MSSPGPVQAPTSERRAGEAKQVVGDIRDFLSRLTVEQAPTTQERARLAHELHDGLLQSLTGLALQLQAVSRLLDTDFEAARQRLNDLRSLMAAEQRELRAWITNLSSPQATATKEDLAAALQKVCRRAEWQWRFSCELVVDGLTSISPTLGDHIYRIVQEGLNNAGRHARAQSTRVGIAVKPDRIEIELSDDGVGFPFHGQYDLARLTALDIGPLSIKERIAALDGGLVLTTGLSGSSLQISLPQPRPAWSASTRQIASD
jgi:signal transduction histidine kinase